MSTMSQVSSRGVTSPRKSDLVDFVEACHQSPDKRRASGDRPVEIKPETEKYVLLCIFTLPHFASLRIGPLDDFFSFRMSYTWIDEIEVY
jgi:hypothetical protein